jgi:hypothetical protein
MVRSERSAGEQLRIKSERDFWSGLMFIGVGLVFAVGAMEYSMGPPCTDAAAPCAQSLMARFQQLSARPGAGFFPLGLSVLLAVLGLFITFKSLTIETPGGDPVGAFAWRPLVVVIAAILAFGVLLEPAGLLIAVMVVVLIVSFAVKGPRWIPTIAIAVALTVFSWAVFVKGLSLTIPVLPAFLS